MTPNEITTLIATNFDKELDFAFKQQLYERVKYWRATLIKQAIDRSPQDAKFFRQTIYIPMEKVNLMECATGVVCADDFKSSGARSTVDVPKTLRITVAGLYEYLGAIDGLTPFGYADVGTMLQLNAGKYSKLFTYYTMVNNRPVISKLPDLPKIRIDDVFENPEEVAKFLTCDGPVDVNCDWWNVDIPLTADITQRIVQSILAVDYRIPEKSIDHQIQVNEQ